MKYTKYILLFLFCFVFSFYAHAQYAQDNDSYSPGDMAFKMPLGGADSGGVDVSMCPEGAQVVNSFLGAWEMQNYDAMYSLIDPVSVANYPIEKARFDFKLLPYREYTISMLRKKGDDFEFLLSSGDWQDGDKDVVKILISSSSKRILLQRNNSPFKASIADRF